MIARSNAASNKQQQVPATRVYRAPNVQIGLMMKTHQRGHRLCQIIILVGARLPLPPRSKLTKKPAFRGTAYAPTRKGTVSITM